MFVRINKSGKRRYLQVVESYRNEAGQGPRLDNAQGRSAQSAP